MFARRRRSYPIRISRQLFNPELFRRTQNNNDHVVIQTRSGPYWRPDENYHNRSRGREKMIMIISEKQNNNEKFLKKTVRSLRQVSPECSLLCGLVIDNGWLSNCD